MKYLNKSFESAFFDNTLMKGRKKLLKIKKFVKVA